MTQEDKHKKFIEGTLALQQKQNKIQKEYADKV